MPWEVVYSTEFEQWLSALDLDSAKSIARSLGILEEFGPVLGRPYVDTLKGSRIKNLKELRTQCRQSVYRTLFVFDAARQAVILVGGDKRGDRDFYRRMIPLAEEVFDDYIRRTSHGQKRIQERP
jgi:hypothetical protein